MATKSEEILGIARFRIKPGKLDEYKKLCEEAMALVRSGEPGTLQYEVYFNSDESEPQKKQTPGGVGIAFSRWHQPR